MRLPSFSLRLHVLASAATLLATTAAALPAQRQVRIGPLSGLPKLGFAARGGSLNPVIVGGSPATRYEVLPNGTLSRTVLPVVAAGSATFANAISADGGLVAGYTELPSSSSREAVVWSVSSPGAPIRLGAAAPYSTLDVVEKTAQGETVAGGGAGASAAMRRPFVYSSARGFRYLPIPAAFPSHTLGFVQDLSGDGSVAVGTLRAPPGVAAGAVLVAWMLRTPGAEVVVLEAIATGGGHQVAGVSPNGRSFCGAKVFTGLEEPVVWLEGDGQQERRLVDPGRGLLAGGVGAVLDDGLVVGNYLDRSFAPRALLWHPSFGSDEFATVPQFLANRGVIPTPGVARVSSVVAAGGQYHFVFSDAAGVTWYAATPDLGANTNTNPALVGYASGTPGAGGIVPSLRAWGSGAPGSTARFVVEGVSPGVLLDTVWLGVSLAPTSAPGPFGARIDLSPGQLLGVFSRPVAAVGAPGSTGALFELGLPPALVSGQRFYLQALVVDPGGAGAVGNALELRVQ